MVAAEEMEPCEGDCEEGWGMEGLELEEEGGLCMVEGPCLCKGIFNCSRSLPRQYREHSSLERDKRIVWRMGLRWR